MGREIPFDPSRRRFLQQALGTLGIVLTESLAQKREIPPYGEILGREVNPAITAVNLSFIPDTVSGLYYGFHSSKESLIIAIPDSETKRGVVEVRGHKKGLQEAIARGQKVYLVVEIPGNPKEYYPEQWRLNLEKIANTFTGASALIIGNEINTPYSPWGRKLEDYLQLYLDSYRIIKRTSPQTRVAPWQEAYFGNGKVLANFLSYLSQAGGRIDVLPINFYDASFRMESRIRLYRQILDKFGLGKAAIIISELGAPIGIRISEDEQANLVVQHLATAAVLQKKGLIEMAAWFCGYGVGKQQGDALSTTIYNRANRRDEFFAKKGLFAFALAQRLLNGEQIIMERKNSGLVEVKVFRQGQLSAIFAWNEGRGKLVYFPQPGCPKIFRPTGERLASGQPLTLLPSQGVSGSGETVVLFG